MNVSVLKSIQWSLAGLMFAYLMMSNSGNPPNGYTGAPPSGQFCGNCHSGGVFGSSIAITGVPSTVMPNQTYPLTVTVSRTNGPTTGKAGFQLQALDFSNNPTGNFSGAGANSTVAVQGSTQFFEHSNAPTFGASNTRTFTVNWTAPASGSITFYASGNVTNGDGSTSGDQAALTQFTTSVMSVSTPPVVTAQSTPVSCFGGTNGSASAVASGGTSPYTYQWSNGSSGSIISTITAGTYTVTVTDAGSQTASTSVTVTQPTNIVITQTNQVAATCTNPQGQAAITVTGGVPGYTYNWSSGQQVPNITAPPGTYSVTVTDQSGCVKIGQATIGSDIVAPLANAGIDRQVSCNLPSIILNGNGSTSGSNITYQWSTTNGNIVSGGNTVFATVNAPGTYTLTVSDVTNGCTSADQAVVTALLTPPSPNAGPDQALTCTQSQVQLQGTLPNPPSNFTIQWSTGNGNIVSGQNTLTPTVNQAGTYTLLVTDTNSGCSAQDQVMVVLDVTSPTFVNAGPDKRLFCTQPSVTIGMGTLSGFTYNWIGPNGFTANTAMTTVSNPGNYTLVVTNTTNGCTASDNVEVSISLSPQSTITINQSITCFGASNGSLTVNSNFGNAPIQYAWSNGATTATISGLSPNIYTVTTSDADNCTSTSVVQLMQPSNLTVSTSASGVTSVGGMDGSATATVSGGTAPYTYAWSNGASTITATNLSAGIYTLTVTDANQCTATGSAQVPNFNCTGFVVSLTTINNLCAGENTGVISSTITGGTTPLTYEWSSGETTSLINSLSTGNYVVTVTDNAGCVTSATAQITAPLPLLITANISNVSCFGGSDGSILLTSSGGVGPYSSTCNNCPNGQANNLPSGSYNWTIQDANGCAIDTTFFIPQSDSLSINFIVTGATDNNNDGQIDTQISGGTAPYSFAWNNGSTTSSLTNIPAGNYCLTVTDNSGCTQNSCVDVLSTNCVRPTVFVSIDTITCFGGNNGSIILDSIVGASIYTFQWQNPNASGPFIGNLAAGVQSLSIVDTSGCVFVFNFNIPSTPQITASFTAFDSINCSGQPLGSATIGVTGGTVPYTYIWSTGSTTASSNAIAQGPFGIVITDAKGCMLNFSSTMVAAADTIAPEVTLIGLDSVYLDNNGVYIIPPISSWLSINDNCDASPITTFSPSVFNCSDIGTSTIFVAATDDQGNVTTIEVNVMVLDTISPVFVSVPTTINVTSVACNQFLITYDNPVSTDNCIVNQIASINSGATVATVPTSIDFLASDLSSNTVLVSVPIVFTTPSPLVVTATGPVICNNTVGSIQTNVVGGTSAYTYSWNDPTNQTTPTATNLSPGSYTVTVTDINGCTASTSYTLQSHPAPVYEVEIVECAGDQAGTITISNVQGTAPFQSAWLNENGNIISTNLQISFQSASVLQWQLIDGNGCVESLTFEVDCVSSSIDIARAKKLWSVAPNPIERLWIITWDAKLSPNAVVVFNQLGQMVESLPIETSTTSTFRHDASQWLPGMYYVQLLSKEGNLGYHRIIKQ